MSYPDWVKGAVIYQVFPDRFARSRRRRTDGVFEKWETPETPHGFKGGDLYGAAERLGHLESLGVTAVYFNPVFASAANHRYHTHDYYRVDPVLGGDAALDHFIKEARRRGIKVILDGVFNHASRGFFQFNHLLENGAASPYRRWFRPHGWPLKAYNLAPGEKANYDCWWNLPALPKFNTDNPEVRRFILGVAEYWLKRGIDGWRLDVPHEIDDDAFWREFRRVCKRVNPACYIVGEIWGEARRWLAGDQFDAVMNYQLSAACISYFGGKKLKLSHSYDGRVLKPGDQRKFLADIKTLLGHYDHRTALVQMNMLSSHDTDRMLNTYGGDEARLRQAAVFSYLFPGAVNLYYGEELGLEGQLNAGTRDAMPWGGRRRWNTGLLKLYRDLGALRRGSKLIRDGEFEFVPGLCDGELLAFRRRLPGRALTCLMNVSDSPKSAEIKKGALGASPRARLNFGVKLLSGGGRLTAALAPRAYAVFG